MDDENKRIDIGDLPRREKELTDEEEKDVTGGGGANFLFGDGSVRDIKINVDSTKANTIGGSLATDVTNPTKP